MQQLHDIHILTLFTSINETQVSGRQVLLSNRKFFLKLDLVTMRVIFNNKGKVCRHKVGSDARQMLPKSTAVQQVSKGKRRHLKYTFSTNRNPVLVVDWCSCKFSQFKVDSGTGLLSHGQSWLVPRHNGTLYICIHFCFPLQQQQWSVYFYSCCSRGWEASFASKCNFWFVTPLIWTALVFSQIKRRFYKFKILDRSETV